MRSKTRPTDFSIASFLIAFSLLLLPHTAGAFWPFSSTRADAATSAVVPSASTPALSAATNLDPTSTLPADIALSGDSALVAYSGPGGTLADVASAPPPDRISVYEVRPGDTLSEIASMYGVSVNTIMWANDLKSATDVHPGDALIILPVSGVEHVVARGDTLATLAKKYGADASEIAAFNGLDASTPLAAGSTVIIPGGELATPIPASAGHAIVKGRAVYEPYLGGSGPSYQNYYENPVPDGLLTQGLHGWNAVDIAAARGTPIHASADGTVIIARSNGGWNGGYGNYVVIDHGNGTQTLYAHMTHSAVSAGESVSQGQVIGYVGMTGMTTGAHVHFEIRGAKNFFAATCSVGERVGLFGCN